MQPISVQYVRFGNGPVNLASDYTLLVSKPELKRSTCGQNALQPAPIRFFPFVNIVTAEVHGSEVNAQTLKTPPLQAKTINASPSRNWRLSLLIGGGEGS